jgi:superfamily II DNA or RNA helicase
VSTVIRGAVITSKIFIPSAKIDTSKLHTHYLVRLYKESGCAKCPLLPARHASECETCQNFTSEIQLWKDKVVAGKSYIAMPPANLERLQHVLDIKLKDVDDRRPIIPLKRKIKFVGKLHNGKIEDGRQTVDQKNIVKKWLETKEGIIQAAPRSGKTVMAVALACELNVTTLIITDKIDLLRQFYKTFMGDPKKDRPAMTNIPDIQTKKRPIIGIAEKVEDIAKYEICLVNYQKFIRDASAMKRIKKYLNGKFTFLILDEAHGAAAVAFSKFVSRLDCKYRLLLSATPFRKDGKSVLLPALGGPVIAKASAQALIPKISIIETGVSSKYAHRMWVFAQKFLANHEKRTELIINQIIKDHKKGHRCIIIPVLFKAHAFQLQALINKRAQEEGLKEKFAEVFHRGCDRENVLSRADRGKIPVLIGIMSMIKQGIDLSTPSMIYLVIPASAIKGIGAPLFYQMSMRVATWLKGKIQPEIKIFIDGIPFSYGCFRSLWFNEILPNLKGKEPRYQLSSDTYDRAMIVAKERQYKPINPPGKFWSSKKILAKLGETTNGKANKKSKRKF